MSALSGQATLLTSPSVPATQVGYDALDAKKNKVLMRSHKALALRETAPWDFLVIDDSTGEGSNATSIHTRWTSKFRDRLRSRLGQGGIVGGFGWLPTHFETTNMNNTSIVAFTPGGAETWAGNDRPNFGLGRRCVVLSVTNSKLRLSVPASGPLACTSVDVVYAQAASSAASITIALDGSNLTTIVTNASVNLGGRRYRVSGLSGGAHNIDVTLSSGSPSYVEGFILYNGDEAAGIRVWEACHSGSTSAFFAAGAGTTSQYDTIGTVNPHLVWLGPGINDYYDSTAQQQTPAQYAANLASIISQVRAVCTNDPPFILAPKYQRGYTGSPSIPHAWSEYVAALYSVAAADPKCLVFDLQKRFPTGVQTGAEGLTSSVDFTHPTDAGYSYIADCLVNWLLPR